MLVVEAMQLQFRSFVVLVYTYTVVAVKKL